MIAFAVFIANIYRNELNEIGSIGYSFILLIVAWPLAIIAAAIGAFASIMAPKQVAEYEDTE